MDIQAGKVILTKNQVLRLGELKSDLLNGLKFSEDGNLVLNAKRDLSESEIGDIKLALASLPDEVVQDPVKDISDKPDGNITLKEVVSILRAKGIL